MLKQNILSQGKVLSSDTLICSEQIMNSLFKVVHSGMPVIDIFLDRL